MKYDIKGKCIRNIFDFYHNVAKKYKHTYSNELMHKNIDDALDAIYLIEKSLPRRKPILTRWQEQGYHMANVSKWYYAYTIDDDTITIQDACHAQNMHNDK